MYCKRLKATMKVSTCQKRQKKARRDLGYKVNAGKESDRDIQRIFRELNKLATSPIHFP